MKTCANCKHWYKMEWDEYEISYECDFHKGSIFNYIEFKEEIDCDKYEIDSLLYE